MTKSRTVKDSMGQLEIADTALYGAQTQRAINNFPISGLTMPRAFIHALGLVKKACAQANQALDLLDNKRCDAIIKACEQVIDGALDDQFPIDVFQTGSGTSTNMNANEVIATLASESAGEEVHANNHVNMSQSSNDVIPSTIHVSASIACAQRLLPAMAHLEKTIESRAAELETIVTTGRTHLMDAMPVTFAQELSGWAAQIHAANKNIEQALVSMQQLAIGGTAVGTGVNAPAQFADKVCQFLHKDTSIKFSVAANRFAAMSSQDVAVALSGQLKTLAVSLMKISNDLRWMNSGPLAGLGEISLPALQPGSSIMPGKINPVIPEAVAMVCAKVIGNDSTITVAGQSGNFQLNVMLPVVAHDLLQSIDILASSCRLLADKAIKDFTVNQQNIEKALSKNPILVTALNRVIGYELGAKIAKTAYAEGRSVIDVASEMTDLSKQELEELLSPEKLTHGGVQE